MKIAALIARLLLGLIFVVFGSNGFLHFIPTPELPQGNMRNFVVALSSSPYMSVIFAVQTIGGVLLLINRYVPLALVLLGPVIVNILLIHLFMEPTGLGMALLVAVLWILVAVRVSDKLKPLFSSTGA